LRHLDETGHKRLVAPKMIARGCADAVKASKRDDAREPAE
jgi:hypothetical protein